MSMSKLVLVPTVLLLLSVMAIQQQLALATKWIPFTCDVGGSNCHNDNVISNAPAASSSRADSVSAAKSQNNVRCFAFCLGCPQLIRAQPQIRTVELTHLTDGNINARYAKDHNCNTNTCIPPLVLMIAEE